MQVALDVRRQAVEPARRRPGREGRFERRRVPWVVEDVADEIFGRGGLEDGEDGRGGEGAFEGAGGLAELEEGGRVGGEGGDAGVGGARGG